MTGILFMGFVLGMRHALDADHVAAVATLTSRSAGARQAVLQGVVWGAGHTLTLFLICAWALAADSLVNEQVAHRLEAAVGAMLSLATNVPLRSADRVRGLREAVRAAGGIASGALVLWQNPVLTADTGVR